MTDDDIATMMNKTSGQHWGTEHHFRRFAYMLLAAERAACADICDQHASIEGIAQQCAAEIRARGNK
jgi:hypothetical protein